MIKSRSILYQEEERIIEFAHWARIALYLFILFLVLMYQLQFFTFLNFEILYPVYISICVAFASELVLQLYANTNSYRLKQGLRWIFALDAFLISSMLMSTKLQNSVFLFFYLYLIFLCGLIFRTRGSLWLAVCVSILFSFFLSTQTQISTSSKVMMFGLNNAAFFVIAVLSGYLSEQLYSLSSEIQFQKKNLAEQKNINQLIINNMQNGLITVDLDGDIVQMNPSALTILGADIAGRRPTQVSEIRGLGGELQFILNTFEQQTDLFRQNIEISYETRGVSKILDFSISKLVINNKILSAFVLIFQDVSEKKRLEEKLKQKEKLAAIGQLAAGIAHEIRNPLASMSGSIQMLKAYVDNLDAEQLRLMNIALKESDRLNDLITEFLEFVKPEIKTDDIVDVAKLITDVLEIVKLNPKLNPHVSQDVQIASSLFIKGNADKLKQVFLNIVMNSYQAMEKKEKASLRVRVFNENGEIKVSIQDNGIGMPEDVSKRVFEPFFTTKPKGTGLGLAIVHKILEAHRADIALNSKENVGTEFLISFKNIQQRSITLGGLDEAENFSS